MISKEKKVIELNFSADENRLYGEFDTQEELDAGYDVEKAVSNFDNYISGFQSGSSKARALLPERTVAFYGHTLMEKLTIFPSHYANAPVLIFIHGGYWKAGLGEDYDFVAMGASQAGCTVVIVTYALAPKVTIPEIVRQVRSAIAWTAKNISNFNGDSDQIFIAGHSAGAHLATMTISTEWKDYGIAENIIKGVLAVSGLYDLLPVSQTFVQPSLRITGEQILSASPIRRIKQSAIPLIVAWGSLETNAFKQQSIDYMKAWLNAGNQGYSRIIEANHFSILKEFEAIDGMLTRAISELIELNKLKK